MITALRLIRGRLFVLAASKQAHGESGRIRAYADAVEQVVLEEYGPGLHEGTTYGSPRVHAQLLRDGVEVGEGRVARLMQVAGLAGKVRRRFKVTTDSRHDKPVAPNTLGRAFAVESSDSVWCAGITYIPTASGWVYLAAILDLATRMIVGWSMASHMRTELVESAVLNALTARAPASKLMHHSDRGQPVREHLL